MVNESLIKPEAVPDLPYPTEQVCWLPDEAYHGDSYRNGGDFVSNSCMKIFNKSPYLLDLDRRDMMPQPSEQTKRNFAIGSATHAKVLLQTEEFVIMPDKYLTASGARSTSKAAKEWVAEQTMPVLTLEEAEKMREMARQTNDHTIARGIIHTAHHEICFRDTTGPIWTQGKLDVYRHDMGLIADLKTCANLDDFHYSIRKFNYSYQMAFYRRLVRLVTGQTCECKVIAVEKEYPYRVGVWAIDQFELDRQEHKIGNDLQLMQHSMTNETWPTGYEVEKIYMGE